MTDTTLMAEPATILVVDDAPINLGVVVDSLENRGFRVFVALDGEEALERAQFSQPDLILLDVKMPGIDGFETCRRLKRGRSCPAALTRALARAATRMTRRNRARRRDGRAHLFTLVSVVRMACGFWRTCRK